MTTSETTADAAIKASGTKLINRKQLLEMVPLSDRTILDMEKRGEFPRRFSITTRLVAWDLHEVERWIEERRAAAIQQAAPFYRNAEPSHQPA
jgi:prophage regulatory protein